VLEGRWEIPAFFINSAEYLIGALFFQQRLGGIRICQRRPPVKKRPAILAGRQIGTCKISCMTGNGVGVMVEKREAITRRKPEDSVAVVAPGQCQPPRDEGLLGIGGIDASQLPDDLRGGIQLAQLNMGFSPKRQGPAPRIGKPLSRKTNRFYSEDSPDMI